MNQRRVRSRDKNREMDYSRSQYGADRFRTQNTSSSYGNDYRDFRETPDSSLQQRQDWDRDTDDMFLNDYRRHHGMKVNEESPNDREDFYFRSNGDYGDTYIAREDMGYFQSRKIGKGPKGYKRSDERIYEDVCEMLFHHPHIDASDVEVEVNNGVVTLKGQVENRLIKYLAEDEAERCSGVTEVDNQLRVLFPRQRN